MRINKITPTNEYRHISFGSLKDRCGASVYSPHGFQPVLAFKKIKRGRSIKLNIDNGYCLVCDPGHIVATVDGPKAARRLDDVYDRLIGYDNEAVSFKKIDGPIVDFYDIEIVSPHWYYTSGILSHNSLMLGNNAISTLKQGHNTMIVTYELSKLMTGLRMVAAMSKKELSKIIKSNPTGLPRCELQTLRNEQKSAKKKVLEFKRYGADLVIYELPPDECSVNDLYAIIDNNRKMRGWSPKVIILDYLELMVARRAYDNERGDYVRQKAIATEICSLAKKENVLVYSATQGNRASLEVGNRQSNNGPAHLGLEKAAESFGKAMPVDYVISLNQRECEYRPEDGASIIRLWIAKNRNGPKFESIETNVYYGSMRIEQPR